MSLADDSNKVHVEPELGPLLHVAPEQPRAGHGAAKSQRVLSCVLCRQRKVKCDRRFPCANCVKAGAQCTSANAVAPRQRRQRLIELVRHYESVLREHDIHFEPFRSQGDVAGLGSPSEDGKGSPMSINDALSEAPRASLGINSKDAVPLWDAISRVTLDADDDDGDYQSDFVNDGDADGVFCNDNGHVRYGSTTAKAARLTDPAPLHSVALVQGNDYLLFGSLRTDVHVHAAHPEQAQIFRLWQIYLDNVNPLLKVTHSPTLQPRIIDAASDMTRVSPGLEALIFSIYCVSVMSLTEDECQNWFHASKKHLLATYQFACHQSLLKCGAWRHTGDIDGLTALFLYLVSVRPQTDASSLSCMLAVAVRTARRFELHNESGYTNCSPFETEMRRRLWWSLVIFDHRICELSDYRTTTLDPTWDCNMPANVNDFEIRPDMKKSPSVHETQTEASFTVVRTELADFVRHSAFHLNLVNPALKTIARPKGSRQGTATEASDLASFEELIESKYLSSCEVDDPLHCMTVWTTRAFLKRNRLLEHYSTHSSSASRPTDVQRGAALFYAFTMLECDTKLRTSPLTRRYLWHVNFYFPILAYLHLFNELKKRPASEHAEQAWAAINDNYETLAANPGEEDGDEMGAIYRIRVLLSRSRVILQAWEARVSLLAQKQQAPEVPPRIVLDAKNNMADMSTTLSPGQSIAGLSNDQGEALSYFGDCGTSMDLGGGLSGPLGVPNLANSGQTEYSAELSTQAIVNVNMGQLWPELNWQMDAPIGLVKRP